MVAAASRRALAARIPRRDATGGVAPASSSHSARSRSRSDGATLYVVNADADSVSVDRHRVARAATARSRSRRARRRVDATTARYTPAVMPRALALSPDGATLYVTGERSGALYAIDVATARGAPAVAVGSEPVGVVGVGRRRGDLRRVLAGRHGRARSMRPSRQVVATAHGDRRKPWALGWSPDGTLAARHALPRRGRRSRSIPTRMTVAATWRSPTTAPRGDQRLAHGQVRGLYDVAARPGTRRAVGRARACSAPTRRSRRSTSSRRCSRRCRSLDRTARTSDAVDRRAGRARHRRLRSPTSFRGRTRSRSRPTARSRSWSTATARTCSRSMRASRVEAALLRPLPGHMPEGIVLSPDGTTAYVDERNTGDVAVVAIARTAAGIALDRRRRADPARSPPIRCRRSCASASTCSTRRTATSIRSRTNHWVACASCHMEGRSDAVTWRFAQGPRDTPSNAGGMLGTGFLFRTADRNAVQDYWHTINIEQGGTFDPRSRRRPLLDAIAAYVELRAFPLPIPPTTDPTKVARGPGDLHAPGGRLRRAATAVRASPTRAPATRRSISPAPIAAARRRHVRDHRLYPDVAHDDVDGDPRAACMFDTPSLTRRRVGAAVPARRQRGDAARRARADARHDGRHRGAVRRRRGRARRVPEVAVKLLGLVLAPSAACGDNTTPTRRAAARAPATCPASSPA